MEHYAAAQQVWVAGLVFFRIGSLLMLIPGIGEGYVPVRMRLSLAIALTFVIAPIAAPSLPPLPAEVGALAGYVIRETLIGLMIGGVLRLFVASLSTAGELISLQTTLAFAQTNNPLEASPSTSISTFLTIMGVVLVFDTDLHRMFISAMAHSYTLFAPTRAVPVGDAATLAIRTVGGTFALGVQMAAPVIVFALVFNVAAGLIGRVMPQFQIYFAATPLILLLGLSIFALSLGAIGMVWVSNFSDALRVFA
jgi:flagellar biosynthetic protein FliR